MHDHNFILPSPRYLILLMCQMLGSEVYYHFTCKGLELTVNLGQKVWSSIDPLHMTSQRW